MSDCKNDCKNECYINASVTIPAVANTANITLTDRKSVV